MPAPRPSQRHSRLATTSASKARPIDLEEFRPGARADLRLPLYQDALARPLAVPFVVVRGRHPGPVLGISAAVHGDELNGIKIIHHVLEQLDPETMHGSVLCAPVVNVPAFQAQQRRFPIDNLDLNHVFPGKKEGRPSEQYARGFTTAFLPAIDYLIDIHTASEGRVNSFYVRVDWHQEEARRIALLMNPEIVLHSRSGDGTLRNAARVRDIPAITVEAGNPSVFQGRVVLQGELGVINILSALRIIRDDPPQPIDQSPVVCQSSKWLRTTCGGLLETQFQLREHITKRKALAEIKDPFGHLVHTYNAPSGGVVIGMSKSPVAVPGTRYCHLGSVGEPLPGKTKPRRSEQETP